MSISGGCQTCARRIREICFIFGINASDVEAPISKQKCKQEDIRSSTCSLPDKSYSFLIHGDKIHDSRMHERYRIWFWDMSAFHWMMVCCDNVSHPAGKMPSTVSLVMG